MRVLFKFSLTNIEILAKGIVLFGVPISQKFANQKNHVRNILLDVNLKNVLELRSLCNEACIPFFQMKFGDFKQPPARIPPGQVIYVRAAKRTRKMVSCHMAHIMEEVA